MGLNLFHFLLFNSNIICYGTGGRGVISFIFPLIQEDQSLINILFLLLLNKKFSAVMYVSNFFFFFISMTTRMNQSFILPLQTPTY